MACRTKSYQGTSRENLCFAVYRLVRSRDEDWLEAIKTEVRLLLPSRQNLAVHLPPLYVINVIQAACHRLTASLVHRRWGRSSLTNTCTLLVSCSSYYLLVDLLHSDCITDKDTTGRSYCTYRYYRETLHNQCYGWEPECYKMVGWCVVCGPWGHEEPLRWVWHARESGILCHFDHTKAKQDEPNWERNNGCCRGIATGTLDHIVP